MDLMTVPANDGRLRSGLPGSAQASAASPALAPGTPVEVCNRFSRTWTRGFEVVAATPGGYRLLRVSDRYELPAEFRTEEIRLAG